MGERPVSFATNLFGRMPSFRFISVAPNIILPCDCHRRDSEEHGISSQKGSRAAKAARGIAALLRSQNATNEVVFGLRARSFADRGEQPEGTRPPARTARTIAAHCRL